METEIGGHSNFALVATLLKSHNKKGGVPWTASFLPTLLPTHPKCYHEYQLFCLPRDHQLYKKILT